MSGETTVNERDRRTTRQESQAQTREKLLESAERLMIAQSIPALSVRQLCAEAGYTQGAFYSNFESKELLLLEVMERHLDQQHDRLAHLAASVSGKDADEAMERLAKWLGRVPDRRQWAALALELHLHAFRDAGFRTQYHAAERRVITQFKGLLESLASQLGTPLALPAGQLAETLLILWHSAVVRSQPGSEPERSYVAIFRQMVFG